MIYNGSMMLLYLKKQESWQVIGGLRTSKFILNNKLIDASNLASENWRELMAKAALRYLDITITGAFVSSLAEQNIQQLAFNAEIAEYRLSFANGKYLCGNFQISNYEHLGNIDEEECYAINLSSSGKIDCF